MNTRRRQTSKRGREKRNIILFAVAVVGLAALIVMALVRRPVMIMPPEPAEIVEKRQAPDNAFFTLQEAVALLPKTKPRLVSVPDKEYPEHKLLPKCETRSQNPIISIRRSGLVRIRWCTCQSTPDLARYS